MAMDPADNCTIHLNRLCRTSFQSLAAICRQLSDDRRKSTLLLRATVVRTNILDGSGGRFLRILPGKYVEVESFSHDQRWA